MADPVLTDDDDVVMVEDLHAKEPIVIDDGDDEIMINKEKALNVPIDVDDELPKVSGLKNNAMDTEADKIFKIHLENNRLIDKIVDRCLYMENSTGMPRVVHKTLLPLYKATSVRFKVSDEFRALLKKTFKQLMKDPDHKFLHVKTLCEQLKSGGIRKVPYVTIPTNLKKKDSQPDRIELTNDRKEINQNRNENVKTVPIPKINKRNYTTTKRSILPRRAKKSKVNPEKTDIIDLDDSETESIALDGSKDDDVQNDVIIVEETEHIEQRNDNLKTLQQDTLEVPKESNKVLQVTLEEDSNKENNVTQENLEKESKNQKLHLTLLPATTSSGCDKSLLTQNQIGKVFKKKDKPIETDSDTTKHNITFTKDSNRENEVIAETLEEEKQNKLMTAPFVNNTLGKVIRTIKEAEFNTQNKLKEAPWVKVINKQGNVIQETLTKDSNRTLVKDSNNHDKFVQAPWVKVNNKQSNVIQENLEKDSNKQNKVLHNTLKENHNNGIAEMDYDLLIPNIKLTRIKSKKPEIPAWAEQVNLSGMAVSSYSPHILNKEYEIARLEERIAYLKKQIDILEEEEVTTGSIQSAYYICSKYKANVVECYKRICQLKETSPDIVKRREVRLNVTQGPSTAAKWLTNFLNKQINETGTVALPDFADVLNCVVDSKRAENLDLNSKEIFKEASCLFRQCGEKLQKLRQKREYKDLLDLIRDKDDDPAEKDPLLLAKLEENKRIAKTKEANILNKYVAMEQGTTQYGAQFLSDKDSSDSEGAGDQTTTGTGESSQSNVNNNLTVTETGQSPTSNVTNNLPITATGQSPSSKVTNNLPITASGESPSSKVTNNLPITATGQSPSSKVTNNLPITASGESSKSNINNNVYYLVSNNLNTAPTMISNNHCNVGQIPNTNNVFVSNLVVTPSLAVAPVIQNPVMYTYLVTTPTNPQFIFTNQNQSSIQEKPIMNDNISNKQKDLDVLPVNTSSLSVETSECETTDTDSDSEIEEKVNPETELTITETTVGFNTATSDRDSNIISISKNNVENTGPIASKQQCKVSDIHNTVPSTSDGNGQNCDPSNSPESVLVKTEDQIKSEPLDIQAMLDELGNDFVSQIFDIEDPFLVIEISSDESSDDSSNDSTDDEE